MKEKWNALLKEKWIWSAFAFGIPFVASIIILAAFRIYPFGENCILHVDMYHQYCPFFMELREKLTNGGSLLYSWNLGLGSDFVSLYAYYLASPLNWLLILCPQQFVIEFMTIITVVKIALGGLFFFWYLKERFLLVGKDGNYQGNTVLAALVFSTAYAFSGYVATYSWNIMWMDAVVLTPLIILGLERLFKKNKPGIYYISLSVAIISNFYISMIICIFLVFYFIVLMVEQKRGHIRACADFALYSILAGGTGAVLLLPEAMVLSQTAADGGSFPEKMEWYFGFLEEMTRMCTLAEPYTTGGEHWPSIYCGAFTIFLVILYVFNNRIKLSEKIPRILLAALLLVSFANNWLNYIWHGFRFPNSLPGRQAFLFIFLMLMMGFDTYHKRKGTKLWHILLAVLLCAGLLLGGAYVIDEEITDPMAALVTGIFIAIYAICLIIAQSSRGYVLKFIRAFAFTIAMCEILINMGATGFYSLNRTNYIRKMDDYGVLLGMAEILTESEAGNGQQVFYRIEDVERMTKNDDALYGYASGTIFSSLMNIDVSRFYQRVYMEGGKNYYCYNGATPLISSMLSVKYMLSDNDEGNNVLRQQVGESGGYYLYENQYCLPLGFMMTEDAIKNWDNIDTLSRIQQINALAHALGVEGDLLKPVFSEVSVEKGKSTITVEEDGFYYTHYKDTCKSHTLTFRINGGASTQYGKAIHRYLFEIGECKEGDVITISNTKSEELDFSLYKMDLDVLDQAYEILSAQTFEMEEYTDTSLKGSIQVTEPGRLIFTIPNENGWTLKIDGKQVLIKDFKDAFISVNLDKGEHYIELSYMTPGLETGAIISIFSVVVAVSMLIFTRKHNRGKSNTKKQVASVESY